MKTLLSILFLLISFGASAQFTKLQIYNKIDGLGTYNVSYTKSLLDTLTVSVPFITQPGNFLVSNYDNTFSGNTRFNMNGNSFNLTSTLTGNKLRLGFINGVTDGTAFGLFAGPGNNIHNDSISTVIAVAQGELHLRAAGASDTAPSHLQATSASIGWFGKYIYNAARDSVDISAGDDASNLARFYPDSIRFRGSVRVFDPVDDMEVANKRYVDDAVASGGVVDDVTGTSPITVSPTTGNVVVGIANAAADGSTKGAASFIANDFNASSGNISIDYTNGQAATSGTNGFLTSTDWSDFDQKQDGDAGLTALSGLDIVGNAGKKIEVDGSGNYVASTQLTNPATMDQDIIVFNGTAFDRLGIGSIGEVLGVNGSGDLDYISFPGWLLASGGTASGNNTFTMGTNTFTISSAATSFGFSVASTYTTVANNSVANRFVGTITQRATSADAVTGLQIGHSFISGQTNQVQKQIDGLTSFAFNSANGTGIFINYNGTIGGSQVGSAAHIFMRNETAAQSRLLGSVYIGSSSTPPTALLHLAAETASASSEPIRFTVPAAQTGTPVSQAFGPNTAGTKLTYVNAAGTRLNVITDGGASLTTGKLAATATNGYLVDGPDYVPSGAGLTIPTSTHTTGGLSILNSSWRGFRFTEGTGNVSTTGDGNSANSILDTSGAPNNTVITFELRLEIIKSDGSEAGTIKIESTWRKDNSGTLTKIADVTLNTTEDMAGTIALTTTSAGANIQASVNRTGTSGNFRYSVYVIPVSTHSY